MSDYRCHRSASGLLAAAALAVGLVVSPAPASAQNFFDLLFGGFRRAVQPPPQQQPVYGDPNNAYPNYDGPDGPRGEGGPSVAFCVRTCDGRHFPIRAANPVEICNSFCPAAPTKVFFGSKIDFAHSSDGRTYRELPAAFAYREKVVDGCTCNGKDPFGLARMDVRDDPTLRPGDIVATRGGLMQATGRGSEFTPISGEMRRRLSEVKIAPGPNLDSEAGDVIPGYDDAKPRAAQSQPSAPAPAPAQAPPRNLRPQISR